MTAIIITAGINKATWAIRRERAAAENCKIMAVCWGDCFRTALRNAKKGDEMISVKVVDREKDRITETERKHIIALIEQGFDAGKIGRKTYYINWINAEKASVKVCQNDRGSWPCDGSPLRRSVYSHTIQVVSK